MKITIDDIDSQIIHALKQNGRIPNTEIAKQLNVSEAAVRKRLKRLVEEEIIQIVAVVNHLKLGYELEGNIKIKIDTTKAENVKRRLNELESLWYIAYLTGAADFDVEFNVQSQEEMRTLIERINAIDGVREVATSVRLQLVKNRYDWETPKFGPSTI
jgi:Lrp/AsnC family transcriptional regulator for asnA, asnC and gidA